MPGRLTILGSDPDLRVRNTLPHWQAGFSRPATFAAIRNLADIARSIGICLPSGKLFRRRWDKSDQFFDQPREIELLICIGIISISFHQNENVFRKSAVRNRPRRNSFERKLLMEKKIELPDSKSPLRIASLIVANDRVRTDSGSEIVHATEL